VEEGGETVFFTPDMTKEVWDDANCTKNARLAVKPVKGAALLFYNIDPSGVVVSWKLGTGWAQPPGLCCVRPLRSWACNSCTGGMAAGWRGRRHSTRRGS
jgi:hypothetical protein